MASMPLERYLLSYGLLMLTFLPYIFNFYLKNEFIIKINWTEKPLPRSTCFALNCYPRCQSNFWNHLFTMGHPRFSSTAFHLIFCPLTNMILSTQLQEENQLLRQENSIKYLGGHANRSLHLQVFFLGTSDQVSTDWKKTCNRSVLELFYFLDF